MNTRLAILAFLSFAVFVPAHAQTTGRLEITYRRSTLFFAPAPGRGEPKTIPFLEGRLSSGARERYGLTLGGGTNAPVLEILGPGGSVETRLSAGGLDSAFIHAESTSDSRRSECVYRLPGSTGELMIRALATGETDGRDEKQQLVVSFVLKAPGLSRASLRLSLPVSGVGEVVEHGLIVSAKTGPGAIACGVYPHKGTVRIVNGTAVLTGPLVATDGASESPLLWVVANGVTGPSRTAAKKLARQALQEGVQGADEPRLVIVVSADKQRSFPGDTVTYRVVCTNVGTGNATNVVLRNPVPAGTAYLDGSATTAGMALSFDMSGDPPSALVSVIKWTLSEPLKPGEERIVGFKVVAR